MISQQGGGGLYNLLNAIEAVFELKNKIFTIDSSRVGKASAFPQKKHRTPSPTLPLGLFGVREKRGFPAPDGFALLHPTENPPLGEGVKSKAAFTLAEGASHGAVSDSHRKTAFTLAEVLITLGIIGVVAALTLPSITQKIDKQITVSKLKKSYSTLQQIIKLSEKDNGEVASWEFIEDTDYAANNSDFFKKYFEPYFKIVGRKGYHTFEHADYPIYNIDGDDAIHVLSWHILPDGTAIGVFSNCSNGGYLWIFIDINAKQGPNRLGKDIFMTELYRRKRLVMLWNSIDRDSMINDPLYPCAKGTHIKYAGGSCGNLIQTDGWEIKDDYPL